MTNEIALELESEVEKIDRPTLRSIFRLLVVWVKYNSQRLEKLEKQINH